MPDSPTKPMWRLQFGASLRGDNGSVEFRIWAPKVSDAAVRILGDSLCAPSP